MGGNNKKLAQSTSYGPKSYKEALPMSERSIVSPICLKSFIDWVKLTASLKEQLGGQLGIKRNAQRPLSTYEKSFNAFPAASLPSLITNSRTSWADAVRTKKASKFLKIHTRQMAKRVYFSINGHSTLTLINPAVCEVAPPIFF